jgi:hypothetical protein
MKKSPVLLIGKRKSVLTRLASELQKEGLSVQWTNNYATAHTDFRPSRFDLVIFGRGVDDRNRLRLQTIYQARNPEIIFLEGIAPIIPLLVNQIRYALLRKVKHERVLAEASCQLTKGLDLQFQVNKECEIAIQLYQLDLLFREHQSDLFSSTVSAGQHILHLEKKKLRRFGTRILSLQVNHEELWLHKLP